MQNQQVKIYHTASVSQIKQVAMLLKYMFANHPKDIHFEVAENGPISFRNEGLYKPPLTGEMPQNEAEARAAAHRWFVSGFTGWVDLQDVDFKYYKHSFPDFFHEGLQFVKAAPHYHEKVGNLHHWRVYFAVQNADSQLLADDYVYIDLHRNNPETLMGCEYCTLPVIASEFLESIFELTEKQIKSLIYRRGIGDSLVPMLPTAEGEVQVTERGVMRGEVRRKPLVIPKPQSFDWRLSGPVVIFNIDEKSITFNRNFYYDPNDKDILESSGIMSATKYNGWQHSSKEIDKHNWERFIFDDQVKISDIIEKNAKSQPTTRKWEYFCPIYFDTWKVTFKVTINQLPDAKNIFFNSDPLKGKNLNNDKACALLYPYTEKPPLMKEEAWLKDKKNWYSYGFDTKATTINPQNIDWTHELGHHWGLIDLWSWVNNGLPDYYIDTHKLDDNIHFDEQIRSIISYYDNNKKIIPWDIRFIVEKRLAFVRDIIRNYPKEKNIILKNYTWIMDI